MTAAVDPSPGGSGISEGMPFLHFGAVSTKAPREDLDRDRCLKLGRNLATKAVELFG